MAENIGKSRGVEKRTQAKQGSATCRGKGGTELVPAHPQVGARRGREPTTASQGRVEGSGQPARPPTETPKATLGHN